MKNITHSQFLSILSGRAGAAIVGITALTDAGARKTGNPFPGGVVMKHLRAVGFVGADYGRAVVRQGERVDVDASAFQAERLPWGEWHKDAPGKVITHKGALYLRTQTTPGQRKRQAARVLSYRDAAGQFLSRDAVRPFLPAPSVSRKQAAVGIGESADSQIMVRTYKFESIRTVRVNGETYNLIADNTQE